MADAVPFRKPRWREAVSEGREGQFLLLNLTAAEGGARPGQSGAGVSVLQGVMGNPNLGPLGDSERLDSS